MRNWKSLKLREHEGKIIGVSDSKIFVFSFTGNLEWSFEAGNISEVGFGKKSIFWLGEQGEVNSWNFFENKISKIQLPEQLGKLDFFDSKWIGYVDGNIHIYR